MNQEDRILKVFTANEILINILKDELDTIGVSSLIKNDFQSGVMAGFSGGTPSSVDLYILEDDYQKAEELISEFLKTNDVFPNG